MASLPAACAPRTCGVATRAGDDAMAARKRRRESFVVDMASSFLGFAEVHIHFGFLMRAIRAPNARAAEDTGKKDVGCLDHVPADSTFAAYCFQWGLRQVRVKATVSRLRDFRYLKRVLIVPGKCRRSDHRTSAAERRVSC